MIYARAYLQGAPVVHRTRETTLVAATQVATDWYLHLRERIRRGGKIHEPTFADVAESFLRNATNDYREGQLNNLHDKWSLLKKHFASGVKPSDIDKKWLAALRQKRVQHKTTSGNRVKNTTLKKDFIFIRLVLRYAKEEEKVIKELPEFPSFSGPIWEILPTPRTYFDKEQFRTLVREARRRVSAPGINRRTRDQRQELYYFIWITTEACLRVDEARGLRWRDCKVGLFDEATHENPHLGDAAVLLLQVLGKHSRAGEREDAFGNLNALKAYLRLKRDRCREIASTTGQDPRKIEPPPDEMLFRHHHRDGFRELLAATGLRFDTEGRTRNLKSLRSTGISRFLDSPLKPTYRVVAKLCRTSVAMVEKFYDQTHGDDLVVSAFVPKYKPGYNPGQGN